MNYSILWNEGPEPNPERVIPDFFMDLNLDQVISSIADRRTHYKIKGFFYDMPKNQKTIVYRQEIFKDLEQDILYEAMLDFSLQMAKAREYKEYSLKSKSDMQKKRWNLDSAYHYCEAVKQLKESLLCINYASQGLILLKEVLIQITEETRFQSLDGTTRKLRDEFEQMQFHIELTGGRLTVSHEIPEENYCDRLAKLFPKRKVKREQMQNPFGNQLQLSALEQKILELFQKNFPQVFTSLYEYAHNYNECMEPVILCLEQELQFYLAFRMYRDSMMKSGYFFELALVGSGSFCVKESYDLALAEKYTLRELPLVRNDAYYGDKEKFLVVTGPNQGGKTTFARGVGQVVYFSLMGLPAPCKAAAMPMFSGILTHFSVEESLETGRGKLKEELVRLQPMMHRLNENKFIIINELFTTAATYDAYIMGNKVMEHFIKNNCCGIYVTHIKELAQKKETVASLVAELDSQDRQTRTFRIVRREADGKGYANSIVGKYHLSYEGIRDRLEGMV